MNSVSPPWRAVTIAGVTPAGAPMWRCQAESQSKVWNGVAVAVALEVAPVCFRGARGRDQASSATDCAARAARGVDNTSRA